MSLLEHELVEQFRHLNEQQQRLVLQFIHDLRPGHSARELLKLPADARARLVEAALIESQREDFETFEAYTEETRDERSE